MTDPENDERITAVREAIALQVTVLGDLVEQLQRDRAFGLSADLAEIVEALKNESDPIERVEAVIPKIRDVSLRLHNRGFAAAVLALNAARSVLLYRASRLICDTQPINLPPPKK